MYEESRNRRFSRENLRYPMSRGGAPDAPGHSNGNSNPKQGHMMGSNSSEEVEGQGRNKAAPYRMSTVIPSNTDYLQFLATVSREFCRQALGRLPQIDEQFYFNIELVMTEAVVNCIRHAYKGSDGPVELDLQWCDDCLTLRVVDYGSPFTEFETYAAREIDDLDPLSTGGRGIIIMRSLMDQVSYSSDPDTGRNVMEMTKSFPAAEHRGD
jgi:anti-sigma regulatory factor (Ser/Thr protein kinase)